MSDYPEFSDQMQRPRYTGIPTFMRTRYTEDLAGVDIGLVGVPFDGGVTNRTGARHGPREIRNQSSLMRRINQATSVSPYELARVADLGDAWIQSPFHLESSLDEVQAFFANLHAAGVVPLSAGGDHSVTLPIMRAIAKDRPVGMVHFDAHCDTGDDYLGSRFHHARRFDVRWKKGCLIPNVPSRLAFAVASTNWIIGSSATTAECAWCTWRSSTSSASRPS